MIRRADVGVLFILASVVHFAFAQNSGAVKAPSLRFQKVQISEYFWLEGAAVADLNSDGHIDIIAGPFWYEGPEFKVRREIFPATQTFKRQRPDGVEDTMEGFEGALGTHNAYSNAFFEFVATSITMDGRTFW